MASLIGSLVSRKKADVGIALPTVDPTPTSIEGAEVLGGQYSLPALGFDSLDPSDPDLAKVSGLSQLPLISGVDATQLEATASALGAGNFGLLTNARDGGPQNRPDQQAGKRGSWRHDTMG